VGYAYAGPWKGGAAYMHSAETTIYLHPAPVGQGLGTVLYTARLKSLPVLGLHALIGGIAPPAWCSTRSWAFGRGTHFGGAQV
jgi:phosphinothricin acetyltransferase